MGGHTDTTIGRRRDRFENGSGNVRIIGQILNENALLTQILRQGNQAQLIRAHRDTRNERGSSG